MTKARICVSLLALPALALLVTPASAHVGIGESGGFVSGLAHPILGVDHLLALLAMGLWSTALPSGRQITALAGIAALLIVSALAGVAGLALPYMETGIGLSVLILGLMLSFTFQRLMPGMLMVALFTLFHGNAHGVEAPAEVHLLGYFAGFTMSSLALLVVGMLVGRGVCEKPVLRVAGGGIALAGLWFVFG
ncbi:urease accessory protein UreJ [Thioalkalivibrio denitrificans]|uniref:Urease accessory protein UreJ n=1 Tax=Thioalkalivibrio denitrificans TaxID=108003 RepID=A0A1V3NBY0_9GAMM|nr:HupE/UreJ family protein [Thioalkalivibrio denitrificans]OOG22443.1 urease accessory protein UreJ [Thioalkalivibrio denitrificans]